MPTSLLWRFAFLGGIWMTLTVSVFWLQERHARQRLEQIDNAGLRRDAFERALLQINDRHIRTLGRARDGLMAPLVDRRIESGLWQRYLEEMQQLLAEARHAVASFRAPEQTSRGSLLNIRLATQLERISSHTEEVSSALAAVQDAIRTEDPETLHTAVLELDRTDTAMQSILQLTHALGSRASAWDERQNLPVFSPYAQGLRILWALWGIVFFVASYRPLARIRRLSRGDSTTSSAPISLEEEGIANLLRHWEHQEQKQQSTLARQSQENQRVAQAALRAERELALLKLYNENLVNSLSAAVVVTDAAGYITSLNRFSRDDLGMDERLIGQRVIELPLFQSIANRGSQADEEIQRALNERQTLRMSGLPYTQGDHERLLDLVVTPYLDESGNARGLIWVADDVTGATRIKEQLLSAEHFATVGRLSAQIAHEIRNPLSAIGLNAELLEEEFACRLSGAARDESLTLLRAIATEIERLSQVTETYLKLARLPNPDLRVADLNQTVSDMFTMLAEQMRATNIEVSLQLMTPAPQVLVDPGQLRQAMLNIVANSREAMPDGGRIQVITGETDDFCTVEMIDNGIGISPEVLPRVFEPFYTTKPAGTGLGLSLTQQIIEKHGGSITIVPGKEGGTRVLLQLRRCSTDPYDETWKSSA
ncbi:MAG: ATP-binding protein [Myxococcota bacterium]